MVSWGVVAMVDEPAALLAAYAAHHLDLGAAEVHLCLDRRNDEAQDLLGALPGVVLHADGEDGWGFRGQGQRPPRLNGRQKYHASRVLAQTRLDWLLHCDADEFLQPPPEGETIATLLARIDGAVNWVQVAVAERVFLRGRPAGEIFAGAFRLPWPGFAREGGTVYGPEAMALMQYGLCGHRMGKAMVRSGRGLFIGVHHGLASFSGTERDSAVVQGAGLRLLHFDGLTGLHYALKMLRYGLAERLDNPTKHAQARQAQIRAIAADAGAAERLQALHAAVKTITPAQAQALSARGLLRRWQPEIAARAARQLSPAPDLTAAAFDRALLAREAALVETVRSRLGFDPEVLAAT